MDIFQVGETQNLYFKQYGDANAPCFLFFLINIKGEALLRYEHTQSSIKNILEEYGRKKHEHRVPIHPYLTVPVMINLVDDEDMMADFLLTEEAMHVGHKGQ